MKGDRLRKLGSQAGSSLTTPGTLRNDVSDIAKETANLIEEQQKTIEQLELEVDRLKKYVEQLTSRGY